MKSEQRKKPFRVISRRTVFRGYVSQLDVLQIQTASGRHVERELICHPGAVVVIPRIAKDRVILVHQLRIATGKKIWEFPAGTLEKGESPWRCAHRELQEETGWRPIRLKKLVEFFPTPGISTEKMYLYLADDLRRSNHHEPDVDEELEVRTFSLAELDRMVTHGEIIDGKTILGFLLLRRYANTSKQCF